MGEREYSALSLEELNKKYLEELAALERSLLDGSAWDEVQDQRITVTRLSQALHYRTHFWGNHPAGSATRSGKKDNEREMA